jgi:hypothetical protein
MYTVSELTSIKYHYRHFVLREKRLSSQYFKKRFAVTPQYTLFTSKNIQRELFEGSDLLQVRSVYFDLLAFKNLTPKDIDTII